MNGSLFERVVAATQLSPLIAPHVVRRVSATCGFLARDMTPSDLERAMPKLLEAIALYVEPGAAARAREKLAALLTAAA